MADHADAASCRTCGGPVERSTGPRGGRPRLHCHTCRPPRPAQVDGAGDAPCLTCGGPVDRSARQRRGGRRRRHCHTCRPPVARRHSATADYDDVAGEPALAPTMQVVLRHAGQAAEIADWSTSSRWRVLAGLRAVLEGHPEGEPVQLSDLQAVTGVSRGSRLARMAQVLDELGLLVDDIVPTMRAWIEQSCQAVPPGFRAEVRAWLLLLLEGDQRARPRSHSTLYAYFGRVRPHLVTWAATRDQLREITENDVRAVLDQLRGHRRAGTFTAVRSLFGFAKRKRLIFADPTRRLHVGRAPARMLLPMTDAQIAAVRRVAVTPAQRLVVALAAVHAARATAIRELTLDDVDLAGRRIRLGGHFQRLPEFVRDALVAWLEHRQCTWPHTPNRYVLVSTVTATGTQPVSDYYLSSHLLLQGVQLEQIRGDRILHEALAVEADPLHLAMAFNLSSATAIAYADIARHLLERPIETATASAEAPAASYSGTRRRPPSPA